MRYKNTDAVAIKEEGATKMPNELKPCECGNEGRTTIKTASRKEAEIKLLPITGDCLESVGVPPRGCRAVINRTIIPVVGDLVWCRRVDNSITSYIKRVKSYKDGRLIVGTAYADHSRDVEFFAPYLYGVVEYVFDGDGDLAYRRNNTSEQTMNKQIERPYLNDFC